MNSMQPTFTTIQEARRWASLFLQKHDREPQAAQLLLEGFLGWSFSKILAYEDEPMSEDVKESFIKAVRAHAETGEPVQHLLGSASFFGRTFKVTPDVLIPRPETEELVLGVMGWAREEKIETPSIVDLGTGSGIIAITASLEIPGSHVTAVDISSEALVVAEGNARQHGADIQFRQGDFLTPVMDETFDILISNPPYISEEEKALMDDTVLDFDPSLALFAEEEGLAAYKSILHQAAHLEQKPLLIAFEIGWRQGEQVSSLIERFLPGFRAEVRQDINGRDRMVFASRRKTV